MDFNKILSEGREDDFRQKYSKKFTKEQMEKMVKLIMPKYLDWVGKVLDNISFNENFLKTVESIKEFDKISGNLPLTDINQYKTLNELFTALYEYKNKERRIIRKVEGGNVVYEDERFFVVNPQTLQSSCYYGKGTKWCTAADSNTQFMTYNQDGKLFYILDKTLKTNDPYYKVALLQKYDGEKIYYDAVDNSFKSGWIMGTSKFKEISLVIDNYLKSEYGEQLKIFADKESAKKERERLERLRIQMELNQRRGDADSRRADGEWNLGPDCSEEGLKAHALFEWLSDNDDIEAVTNEDRAEIDRLEGEISTLETLYDEDENTRTDLLDQISELEDELEELKLKVDVYNVIPEGQHYDMSEFVVIDADLGDRRYAVGTESEVLSSCEDYVEGLIDDIGYGGFNESFTKNFIDEDEVLRYAEELYENDIREAPEAYFNDEEKELSRDQEEKIQILKERIARCEEMIDSFESEKGENDEIEGYDDEIQEKIEELQDSISEMEEEITEIEEDPDGDYPQELYDERVKERLDDVRRDITSFMEEWQLDWADYINKRDFIEGIIDADGYGMMNGYDGNCDEVSIQNQTFYVMRID